jgi:hypothetical protein
MGDGSLVLGPSILATLVKCDRPLNRTLVMQPRKSPFRVLLGQWLVFFDIWVFVQFLWLEIFAFVLEFDYIFGMELRSRGGSEVRVGVEARGSEVIPNE